ncbi:MAG: T9SS type A sorting domain-containing protein, partial [Chitinophagales bacterium]|nr:T9SS type A sorting domain-containing protein [Chitinophagales bacterium]
GASHPYSVQFAGREAIWKFTAIMLPDSNSNEPQSHGHVTFSILPKPNLGKGTQITNTADIYFDYNAPVATNSTLNTIDYELSVADLENGKVAITLMPNPFKEFTTIKIDGENTAYELKMFDMLGQQIYQDRTTNNLFSIQRQTLAAGVYMYQITKQGKVIGQGKMIAE